MSHKNRPPLANIRLTVDVSLFTIQENRLKVLLTRRKADPFIGCLALPGVFIWENETSLDSSLRALKNKTGVTVPFVSQLHVFDNQNRDPRDRIVSIAHYALVPESMLDTSSLEKNCDFIDLDSIDLLAFDHKEILNFALNRLQEQIRISNIAFSLLPKYFTLTELQSIHEVVLGEQIDKRNFRKNILANRIIKETKKMRKGLQSRPAKLYEFTG